MVDPELLRSHERATERFADVVASLPTHPVPVPGLDWSSLEVAAHVLSVLREYAAGIPQGRPLWDDPRSGPAENARLLAATPERDPVAVATGIRTAGAQMRDVLDAVTGDVPVFGSVRASGDTIVGVNLGDPLLHGYDLARAVGRDWTIERRDAAFVFDRVLRIAPAFVDADAARDVHATYAMTLRRFATYTLRFDGPTLMVTPGRPAHADCRINADAVGLLLSSYGRTSPIRAALTGKIVVYGRRPWLGLTFDKLLVSP